MYVGVISQSRVNNNAVAQAAAAAGDVFEPVFEPVLQLGVVCAFPTVGPGHAETCLIHGARWV